MEPIPLPSLIHYELILQLLERQTLSAVSQDPILHEQVRQLIISIRKAAAQQKDLQELCQLAQLEFESRWSLNYPSRELASSPDYLSLPKPEKVSDE